LAAELAAPARALDVLVMEVSGAKACVDGIGSEGLDEDAAADGADFGGDVMAGRGEVP